MVNKPDKFYILAQTLPVGFSRGDVASLLYHYHQEVVELVKQEKTGATGREAVSRNLAIDDIVTRLKEFAK